MQRHPKFYQDVQILLNEAMRNTANVTGGKPFGSNDPHSQIISGQCGRLAEISQINLLTHRG
jgi:hypothetical protein